MRKILLVLIAIMVSSCCKYAIVKPEGTVIHSRPLGSNYITYVEYKPFDVLGFQTDTLFYPGDTVMLKIHADHSIGMYNINDL